MISDVQGSLIPEQIDRLVSCDPRARSFFPPLYEAARRVAGEPMCGLAARRLAAALADAPRGTAVLFVTGFVSPFLGVGEQDGPVGAAYLGRVLNQAFGAVPVMITDDQLTGLVTQTLRGGGFNVLALERALDAGRRGKQTTAAVLSFPADGRTAAARSREILETLKPPAVVAIERPGANSKGICHSFTAVEIDAETAPTDHLFRAARDRGVLTIGIGDGGNELGCGGIRSDVERILGERARCADCGGTIAAAEPADVLVMATVSDWGAYGVAAALAARLGRPGLMPTRQVLERTLLAASLAGARNGVTDWTDPGSDAYPPEVELGILVLLEQLACSQP